MLPDKDRRTRIAMLNTMRCCTQGAYNSGKHGKHGNLRNLLILENSGNLQFTQGIYQMLLIVMIVSLGHQVVCIIVSNSSVNWLSETATGMDGASHHATSIKYSVILQESCLTDSYGDLLHRVFTL